MAIHLITTLSYIIAPWSMYLYPNIHKYTPMGTSFIEKMSSPCNHFLTKPIRCSPTYMPFSLTETPLYFNTATV